MGRRNANTSRAHSADPPIRACGSPYCALQAPQGMGNWRKGNEHRVDFPPFWVKEGAQTGTMARHTTRNGQKCCDNRSAFTSTPHEGYRVPCSTMIARIVRRRGGHRRRRIGSPCGSPCNSTGSLTDPQPRGQPEPIAVWAPVPAPSGGGCPYFLYGGVLGDLDRMKAMCKCRPVHEVLHVLLWANVDVNSEAL